MILATSFTATYSPAEIFIQGVRERCNVPFIFFAVDHEREGCLSVPTNDFPKWMLQNGHFTQFLDHEAYHDETILFTDADIRFQRPFTDEEILFLDTIPKDVLAIGPNGPAGTTLFDESKKLVPRVDDNQLDEWFPGWRTTLVWNTGAIAAKGSTWNALYAKYLDYNTRIEASFLGPARVQWLISYLVGVYFKHTHLPLTIHAHGHCGHPEGVTVKDRIAYFEGEPVVLAHMLV